MHSEPTTPIPHLTTDGGEIRVSVARQQLDLLSNGSLVKSWPVSTSKFGLGSEPGSYKTPTGRFLISDCIGEGAPEGAVFKSRIPTGEIGSPESTEDLVQTRILWLDGLDAENANTRGRYVYIHGTNQEGQIGLPASHGCVRMRNSDVIELFTLVTPGITVVIEA